MRKSAPDRLPIWIFPFLALAFVALWQWATVRANFGGNWTALFCTGAIEKQPALNAAEHVYLFKNSTGYDGQFYRYIAHDPLLRSGLKDYIDDARMRYRRVFVPLLAYALALGVPDRIDRAYECVFLLTIAFGVYWSCQFARDTGLAAAWGLLFLAMPAIPVSADRLVIDGALAALTAGFVYYSRAASWKLFTVLACAALTRETGFLLILAYCAHVAWRREFRTAAIYLLSGVPAIAWFAYVQANTNGGSYRPTLMPAGYILSEFRHPAAYPPDTPFLIAVRAADGLALAGALLGFALALLWFVRAPHHRLRLAAALFAIMGIVFQITGEWQSVYNFGRIYTPMLICLAALGAQTRTPLLLLPAAMMLPRIAMQLAPQALGVLHRIL